MIFFTNWRRNKVRAQLFPPTWETILKDNFNLYSRFTAGARTNLQGHIQVFLDEKTFEGCGGLKLNDKIRVTIAGQACLLLLHRDMDYFPRVRSILVYPSEYVAKSVERPIPGVVSERDAGRLGESWQHGTVVLSWRDSWLGGVRPRDGVNLVYHEFAHQVDELYGLTVSLTEGDLRTMKPWRKALRKEFLRFSQDVAKGNRTLLDTYGAENPAEFFAVSTECFFERPVEMRESHLRLYRKLQEFYCQNPSDYFKRRKNAK